MRIPSSLNDSSLYRRRRSRHESVQEYRRLLRLFIGLVLVIVLMQQASRPALYEVFFGPQSGADRSTGIAKAGVVAQTLPAEADLDAVDSSPIPISPQHRRIAAELCRPLPAADHRAWVVALSRWQAGRDVEALPVTFDSLRQRLATLPGIDDETRHGWDVMLESLQRASSPGQRAGDDPDSAAAVMASAHAPQVAALLAWLDETAASRVVDGSVWRSADFDAFYRYLDQADSLSRSGATSTSVLPLLQQPDVFRHQLVLVRGHLARAERITARENPYEIADYWQLWLRPIDGADRPLVAIVRAVPDPIAAVGAAATVQQGPPVAIVGRFLKRLAYQSAMGADLAPVIVGRLAALPPSPSAAAPAASDDDPDRHWRWLVAMACLVGFALAAVPMWRTSVMNRRVRLLRTQRRKQPDAFLSQLGEVNAATSDPSKEEEA